jgi:hypothetical protein
METVGRACVAAFAAALTLAACNPASAPPPRPDVLIGAWRSQINASDGELAEMKNLEFMYVFNAGGTMTESSNYDSAPPVPPAYGVWRKTAPRQFEAKYAFYMTKPPSAFEEVAKGGGWEPSGYGILTEKITVAEDGKSYNSTLVYTLFDASGREAGGGGAATGAGVRIDF